MEHLLFHPDKYGFSSIPTSLLISCHAILQSLFNTHCYALSMLNMSILWAG
jgi:hypothetical protein